MSRRKHEHTPSSTGKEGAWRNIDGTTEIREICTCGADRFIEESTREPVTAWTASDYYDGD